MIIPARGFKSPRPPSLTVTTVDPLVNWSEIVPALALVACASTTAVHNTIAAREIDIKPPAAR
jgi:hypothetical protein